MLHKRKESTYSELKEVNNILFEIRTIRNRWAHLKKFDDTDTFRALDCVDKIIKCAYTGIGGHSADGDAINLFKKYYILKMADNIKKEMGIGGMGQQPMEHNQPMLQNQQHPFGNNQMPMGHPQFQSPQNIQNHPQMQQQNPFQSVPNNQQFTMPKGNWQ